MKLHNWGAVAAAFLGLLGSGAQAMPKLINLPVGPVTAGSSFIVTLQEDNFADGFNSGLSQYLADFYVAYDSSRLSLTLVTPVSSLLAPDLFLAPDTPLAGPLPSPAHLFANGDQASGSDNLFDLTFEALQVDGFASIEILNSDGGVDGFYGDGTAVAFNDAAARVQVQAATPPLRDLPEPQSLALMAIAGLGAIAGRRRNQTSR